MNLGVMFFLNSILLGIGLAMDAFSVSLANGLNEPNMKKGKMFSVAGMFAAFQAAMPLIGWICVHTVLEHFKAFEKAIPYIAFILLGYIGGKMVIEGIKNKTEETEKRELKLSVLFVQGVATSIDALSVGFTIADYNALSALISALIIAAVTFGICFFGIMIGKRVGTALSGMAGVFGGIILILIGCEIFITGLL